MVDIQSWNFIALLISTFLEYDTPTSLPLILLSLSELLCNLTSRHSFPPYHVYYIHYVVASHEKLEMFMI